MRGISLSFFVLHMYSLGYNKVIDGHKYLVKSGRGDGKKKSSILEPITECICYEIAKDMGIDCAEYLLEEINGEILSVSKWFYDDKDETFYSANKLMKISNITKENLYNKLIDNIEGIQEDMDNMIVFDYIINNTDRHLKNFGFLTNGDKIRFAPIYDNGLALGSHLDDEDIEFETIEDLLLVSDYAKCFDTSNKKQLSLVNSCSLNLDVDYESIIYKYSKYLCEKRVEFMITLLKERILEVKKCLYQKQN